jgi:polysaccharide pyruvyl transferase WcaK-like protein
MLAMIIGRLTAVSGFDKCDRGGSNGAYIDNFFLLPPTKGDQFFGALQATSKSQTNNVEQRVGIGKLLMSVLVVNDTRVDRHHGCYAVMAAIGELLRRNTLGPVCYWPAHTNFRECADFVAAVASARLVVVNGEGTIHHDRAAGRRLLEVGAMAREAGARVALINTGWEDNGSDFLQMLEFFDLVAARDTRSAARMALDGMEIRVVPDLSFWYSLAHAPKPCAGRRAGVGFTDNVDRLKSLALERTRRACGGETLAITHGKAGLEGSLQFLREGLGLREDIRYPLRIASLLNLRRRLWRSATASTDAFLANIARLELLVSGRFHACTLALAMGTPVVSQSSNTDKIAALFNDVGLETWRNEIPLNPGALREARSYGWAKAERVALDAYLARAVTEAERLFTDLAKLAAR